MGHQHICVQLLTVLWYLGHKKNWSSTFSKSALPPHSQPRSTDYRLQCCIQGTYDGKVLSSNVCWYQTLLLLNRRDLSREFADKPDKSVCEEGGLDNRQGKFNCWSANWKTGGIMMLP